MFFYGKNCFFFYRIDFEQKNYENLFLKHYISIKKLLQYCSFKKIYLF